VIVAPIGLQAIDQLAGRKPQAALEIRHAEQIFAGPPILTQVGQHDQRNHPLVVNPKQAAVVTRHTALEASFRRTLDFRGRELPGVPVDRAGEFWAASSSPTIFSVCGSKRTERPSL
jgi:hypothetical protein